MWLNLCLNIDFFFCDEFELFCKFQRWGILRKWYLEDFAQCFVWSSIDNFIDDSSWNLAIEAIMMVLWGGEEWVSIAALRELASQQRDNTLCHHVWGIWQPLDIKGQTTLCVIMCEGFGNLWISKASSIFVIEFLSLVRGVLEFYQGLVLSAIWVILYASVIYFEHDSLHFLYKRCNKIDMIRNIQTLLIGAFARTITSMSTFLINVVRKHVQVNIFAFDLVSQLILLQLEQIICLINFIKVLYKT